MSRNSQVSRILRTLHYLELSPNGLAARDIRSKLAADGFECSRETGYRDLQAIQDAMFPLERSEDRDHPVWKLASITSLNKNVSFTYNELLALFIARRSLEVLRGSPIFEALDQFFVRLEKLFGPKANEAIEEFTDYLGFKPRAAWQTGVAQEILDSVHAACSEGHMIEIDYQSTSGERAGEYHIRKVGPASIMFADSGIYLVAEDTLTRKFKTYSMSRIRQASLLDEHYDSSSFKAEDYFKSGFGVLGEGEPQLIEIQIAEPMASYVSERRWHETQRVVRTPDGIVLSMTVKVNDELARWILGLGGDVVVNKPSQLRERVLSFAQTIQEKNRKAS